MAANPNAPAMSNKEKEREARVATEQWRLKTGRPPEDPSFRMKDASGNEVLNIQAIYKMVDMLYGVSSSGQDLFPYEYNVNPKMTKVGPWKCP